MGAVEYGDRSLSRPLAELVDELAEETADLGGWGVLAQCVLDGRRDLEEGELDQARALLATIDERTS